MKGVHDLAASQLVEAVRSPRVPVEIVPASGPVGGVDGPRLGRLACALEQRAAKQRVCVGGVDCTARSYLQRSRPEPSPWSREYTDAKTRLPPRSESHGSVPPLPVTITILVPDSRRAAEDGPLNGSACCAMARVAPSSSPSHETACVRLEHAPEAWYKAGSSLFLAR